MEGQGKGGNQAVKCGVRDGKEGVPVVHGIFRCPVEAVMR